MKLNSNLFTCRSNRNMSVLFVSLIFSFFLQTFCRVDVKINQGTVYGTTESTVFNGRVFYAFYGVPYAQAPLGKLRFKNPVPIKKWKRPFDATTEYHGACAQGHIVHKHGLYGFEDCLHLNIYTPYLPKYGIRTPKAVIVWIHGYAFTSSLSHIHGADFLIDNDVVFVTLTHRLSVFGFLKLNETDNHTNMGLKDIVMGLKWIRRNIKYFGGDSERVTIMSSGSAATFVSLLMMTKFRRLFSKVILQSGSIYSPSIFQGDSEFEKIKLEKALMIAGFPNITSAPTNEIITSTAKIYDSQSTRNYQRPMIPFMPLNETQKRSLISKRTLEISENLKHLKFMDIMVGFTTQESITEVLPFIHNPQHLKSFQQFKYLVPFSDSCRYKYGSKKYREIGNLIRQNYFKNDINEASLDGLLKYVSDLHKYPIYKFIQTFLKSSETQLYVYKFNYVGNFSAARATSIAGTNVKIKGAAHGDEICYILKCDPLWENYVKIKDDLLNRDRIFITQIAEIWANFAKKGEPTLKKQVNVTWVPMTLGDDSLLLFGKQNKLVNSRPERKMFDFWNMIYEKYYSPNSCKINYKDEL